MSSINKTTNLRLNQWASSDKPERMDFNYDNEMIDNAITKHKEDAVSHVSNEDREKWNMVTHFGMYFGNGEITRTIETNCPFEPIFVLIFPSTMPASYVDFAQGKKYNYMACASQISSMSNLVIEERGAKLTVTEDIASTFGDEYVCLNQVGIAYTYVMFR